ncbi:hypothetical protein GCM10011332_30660 [Terasakiella brassicae]|uniref:Uncharacterized protein n=1 Tax=Terasakiella brassicae TaxID=1634917 RepID=A0A917C6J0_9PROT|nr:hypothetical protein [Terasakiella brassicae]GGF74401.1 hypothetical protein GCM10011332_30660 [Terasakiella brassicae]
MTTERTATGQTEEYSIAALFESDVHAARPHWTKETIIDFMDTFHDTILDEIMANLNDWLHEYQEEFC